MLNNLDLTQTVLIALRNQGFDVPDCISNAAAVTHFGGGLAEGKRYYNTVTEKIMVYTGTTWIIQKTS